MTPRLRKIVLTSHITFSVGWLGSVTVFLVLAFTALTSTNLLFVRSAFIDMKLSAWFIIVPFCLASLSTGIIQAVGTRWGLFKHYWIIVKLFLTIAMTILLLLHMQPISYLAGIAADTSASNIQQSELLIQLIAKAGAALLVLIAIVTISVFKPWGRIGIKQQNNNQQIDKQSMKKSPNFYLLIAIIILIVILIITHVSGGGISRH